MGGVNTKNYHELGGERTVVGGSLDVVSGGDLDVESGGTLKLAGAPVTASAAELNKLTGATIQVQELNALDGAPLSCSISVSSPIGTGKFVTIQLKDAVGSDLGVRGHVFSYLAKDAVGDTLSDVALSTGVATYTDGLLIEVLSKKAFHLVSEADGDIDVAITHNDTASLWLALVLPNGKLAVSGTIAFTGA